mmetsp:Transcript_89643/g.254128  ORF Transcript_89643/g.254128 Transcript_89643/m.254128 type:complete len:207 (-) Transcript_89643:994-1614(-)
MHGQCRHSRQASEFCVDGDVHGLHLRVIREAILTELAADSALLEATKWGGHVKVVEAVHPHRARPEQARQLQRGADVPGADTRGEPVLRGVRAPHRVQGVGELEDAHHRAEDLLRRDGHAVGDVGEHGRLDVEALLAVPRTARDAARPVLLPCSDVIHHLVELDFVHLRAMHARLLELRAWLPRLRGLHRRLDEFVVDVGVDEEAR